jgi:hypothetical protein
VRAANKPRIVSYHSRPRALAQIDDADVHAHLLPAVRDR